MSANLVQISAIFNTGSVRVVDYLEPYNHPLAVALGVDKVTNFSKLSLPVL